MNRKVWWLIGAAVLAIAGISLYKMLFAKPETITFSEHIAPIVYQNCAPCHHKGGAGPFPLMSYNDVAKRARMVARVTKAHYMPPWPADPSYTHFLGEKRLSDEQIDLIQRWAAGGAPLGNPIAQPAAPDFSVGSLLGKPDTVVHMTPFLLPGKNQDAFMVIKVPFELSGQRYVRAVEFVPGQKKLVHHVNGQLVRYDQPEKKRNVYDGERAVNREVYDYKIAYQQLALPYDDGTYPTLVPSVTNYLPGVYTTFYPPGIGGFVAGKKNAFLLRDIHYGPSPKPVYDSSYFNIFFSPVPPQRPTRELQLGTYGVSEIVPALSIQPNEIKTFRTQFTLPADISVLTVNPHMHLIGKTFKAYAVTLTNDTIPLIRIRNWDFRWQYFYTYPKMVKIPAGATIYVEALYDNTTSNPNNPFNPPHVVSEREGSMRTSDEMLQFIITYLPYQPGDENISLAPKAE